MKTHARCAGVISLGLCAALTSTACTAPTVDSIPVTEHIAACSLDGNTTAVLDSHGWPHIYADSLRDAACAQGYLQARDRMAQMELFRRYASGSLAEIVGALSPEFMDGDIAIRALGLRQRAAAMLEATRDPRARGLLEGFANGVNFYLLQMRSLHEEPPRGTTLVLTEDVADWSATDSLVVLLFEAYSVGFGQTISSKISRTAYNQRLRTTFDEADASTDPDRHARSGLATDLFAPGVLADAPTLPDFEAQLAGAPLLYRPAVDAPRISESALRSSLAFVHALPSLGWHGSLGGSNAWVVDASRSANGHALLGSDPHLDFMSPSIFWGSHLTVRGADAVDAAGFTIPGLPGVLFGFNRDVAWGVTVAYADTVDLYDEHVIRGNGVEPDAVMFEGHRVALDSRVEHIPDGYGGVNDVTYQIVPHHGPIVPNIERGHVIPAADNQETSFRWAGVSGQATHDFELLASMMYQSSAAGIQQVAARLGSLPLNWLAADRDHGTYTFSAAVPIRPPSAMSWNPRTNPYGSAPWTILPGTGEAEWTGIIPSERLPHATTSATQPFLVSANNDPTGGLSDGNPLDDIEYLGYGFASGLRAERIRQVLDAHDGPFDPAAMQLLQNDHRVGLAERFRPFIHAAFARLETEWTTPGSQQDLTSLATALRADASALRDASTRLDEWSSLDAASGVDSDDRSTRADAVAASIFHRWLQCFVPAAIDDEFQAVARVTSTDAIDWRRYYYYEPLLRLMEHPELARTLDASTGQSALWDNLETPSVRETRDAIILAALQCSVHDLATAFESTTADDWLWGKRHTAIFPSMIPGPGAALTVPSRADARFAGGFPRGGGADTVDIAAPDPLAGGYRSTTGAVYRLVAGFTDQGIDVSIAVAGGEVGNPDSRHLGDDAFAWSIGQLRPLPFHASDVVHDHETRIEFGTVR